MADFSFSIALAFDEAFISPGGVELNHLVIFGIFTDFSQKSLKIKKIHSDLASFPGNIFFPKTLAPVSRLSGYRNISMFPCAHYSREEFGVRSCC